MKLAVSCNPNAVCWFECKMTYLFLLTFTHFTDPFFKPHFILPFIYFIPCLNINYCYLIIVPRIWIVLSCSNIISINTGTYLLCRHTTQISLFSVLKCNEQETYSTYCIKYHPLSGILCMHTRTHLWLWIAHKCVMCSVKIIKRDTDRIDFFPL